jgi:hypothetical protein
LWLIKVWFYASTFVVKIATFAKPENVVCLESSDKRNFAWWMSAENYMEAQKWDWPSAQGCQEYCANRFMLHLGKLFCGER